MSERGRDARVASLMRRAAPPSGPGEDTVIAAAMLAGAARHRRRERTRFAIASGAVLALAAAVALAVLRPPSEDGLSRFELTSGDVLTGASGARFRALDGSAEDRVVALEEGAMLFEVQPLELGESFEVRTADCVVRVRGTIFSVGASAEGTRVEVFEGHVEVERRGAAPESLRAGDASGPALASVAPLRAAGLAAARERAAQAPEPRLAAHVDDAPPRETPSRETPPLDGPASEQALAPATARIDEPLTLAPSPETEAMAVADRAMPGRRARDAPAAALSPSDLRALVASGDAERALADVAARLEREDDPELRFVEGDALRALGRHEPAARSYERAAAALGRSRAPQAGYLAAQIRLERLGEPELALAALDVSGASGEGSPLRERALLMRARALDRLGRSAELAEVARAYVELYPSGSGVSWLAAHARR